MKKILIISPHFPPSNLAAVHRSRLFAQHLPSFGWTPIILTVHEKYYEEKLDWNLAKLLPPALQIEKVKALPVGKPRLIGDIGLRAFFQLYKKAKQLIQQEKIDFLFIPIPSFYVALLGRWLYHSTGVRYGIDYIDPWVHTFPGSDKKFSRHWWSSKIAQWLEPIAIKKASLITGVAAGYYAGVIERNPAMQNTCVFGAMPYGSEATDHHKIKQMDLQPFLFQKKEGVVQMVYAGAMLPKAYGPLEAIFKSISQNPATFAKMEIHFIGTGKLANDATSFNIKPLAEKYGLWQQVIFEYPARIAYMDVLVHLQAADGIFILGSTEPHYTPSKVFQGVLSQKALIAVLHDKSSAINVIKNSNAGIVLAFAGEDDLNNIEENFVFKWVAFLKYMDTYSYAKINTYAYEEFSAYAITRELSKLIDRSI